MSIKSIVGSIALFLIIAVIGQAQVATRGTGQIQGKLVAATASAAASPIGTVTVSAFRMRPSPVVTSSATAASGGAFTIGGLPTGAYSICVTDPSRTYVNPCEWASLGIFVDVTDGKVTSAVTVSLKTASVLQVRVNDVASALAPRSTEPVPPHVLVVVKDGTSSSHMALEARRDATGIDYTLVIPFDTPLRLQVQSKLVALATTSNAPLPAQGLTQTFQHDSTKTPQQQPTFTFNAIGRNP